MISTTGLFHCVDTECIPWTRLKEFQNFFLIRGQSFGKRPTPALAVLALVTLQ